METWLSEDLMKWIIGVQTAQMVNSDFNTFKEEAHLEDDIKEK